MPDELRDWPWRGPPVYSASTAMRRRAQRSRLGRSQRSPCLVAQGSEVSEQAGVSRGLAQDAFHRWAGRPGRSLERP